MYQRNNFRRKVVPTKKCSCGSILKQRSRKNYPFGKKSKSLLVIYFKCINCGEKFN